MDSRGEDRGHTSPATETVADGPVVRAPSEPLAVSTLLANRYEIRDLLGRGGFAHVYLAWDHALKQSVALKVLRSERVSPTSIQRFRRSVALARDLSSPYLARVFDVGRDGEHLFLAMEVLEGGTLADLLRQEPLPISDAVEMAREIFTGLADLHRQGILHRDLKPANILIDPAGHPKIADFDFARLQDPTVTRATRGARVVGTLAYLSPEQALGDEVDERSDLYSAGLIFFELLTGKRPYPGRSTIGSIVARLTEPPVDIRRNRKNIPPWLRHIVNRLIAARPEDRYESAEAVLADIAGERATPAPIKHRRFKAHLAVAMVCSLVALAALVALTGFGHSELHKAPAVTVERLPSGELIARDTRGRVAWRRDGAASRFVPAVISAGAPTELVGILRSGLPVGGRRPPRLTVLDPRDGAITQSMVLPATAGGLPQLAEGPWNASVRAMDLDGDGVSEVLATFFHRAKPFSYTVLIEPRISRTRTVFVSNQPGRFVGETDIDGDGIRELIFLTHSSPFDETPAISAVRLSPGIDQGAGKSWQGSIAVTPEQAWQVPDSSSLLWFTLLGQSPALTSLDQLRLVRSGSGVTLVGRNGAKIELDRYGFSPQGSAVENEQMRAAARREAYRLMRKARRAIDRDALPLALETMTRAAAAASTAHQATLAAWIDCHEGALLVTMHRTDEAEREFGKSWHLHVYRAKTARFAGDSYLLNGEVGRALAWYQRGLEVTGLDQEGSEAFALVAHLTFAYQTRGDLGGARSILLGLSARPDLQSAAATLLSYIDWRQGRPTPGRTLGRSTYNSPLARYWELELEWQRGAAAPADLLRQIKEQEAPGSELEPLFLSLDAMVTASLGDRAQAETLISKSITLARDLAPKSVAIRAHLDLIRRRQEKIGGPSAQLHG